jgi:hypothetical protein
LNEDKAADLLQTLKGMQVTVEALRQMAKQAAGSSSLVITLLYLLTRYWDLF